MKPFLLILVLLVFGCKEKTEAPVLETSEPKDVQSVEDTLAVYDFAGIEKYLHQSDGKTYVVNFWATWCVPCVKELPYFEALNQAYKEKGVEVLLVSLDFPKDYETRLRPFLKKHQLESKVLVLNDPDMNTWIPKVDENWSGAIPATLIYNATQRRFFEQPFTYIQLENEVQPFLN
ncbi:MAG TPA: TlpA disulfide reductase family protein [Flavobacteriaceae bacterium]|nr:TlpA disulfide reductase family protein [Flavobacteriaceae bacterium]